MSFLSESTLASLRTAPLEPRDDVINPHGSPLVEEDENDLDTNASTAIAVADDPQFQTLPWHHKEMYRMFGKQADYYLHPKIEDDAKKRSPKPLNEKMKEHASKHPLKDDVFIYSSILQLISQLCNE